VTANPSIERTLALGNEVVPARLEDLLTAMDWVSSAGSATLDCAAYVDRSTGKVYWIGEGVDEESPEGLEDGTRFAEIPHKSDLGLGRDLVLRFAEHRLPRDYETVHQQFSKKGAYAVFKGLLQRRGMLDAWHGYEQEAAEKALLAWCAENGVEVTSE
jgi:hypothetical protein